MITALIRGLCCLLLVWASAAQADGAVVAIGGALKDDNTAVWSRVVQLAGGPGARFVVLATASGDPERAATQIAANLQRQGALATHLRSSDDEPTGLALLAQAQGVFFSGGEQARLLDLLQPRGQAAPWLTAMRALLARGGVVAGTSAGAAVLSHTMFRDAPDVFGALLTPLREGLEIDRGFALVPADVVVDQHFLKRGRIGRLLPLLLHKGVRFGLGVEEDSAAVIRGHDVQAIGARGVLVIDTAAATRDAAAGAFNVRGVQLTYLAAGDRVSLLQQNIEPAAGKAAMKLHDRAAAPTSTLTLAPTQAPWSFSDMLGDGVVLQAMTQLVRGGAAQVTGLALRADSELGFEWLLVRDASTRAWAGRGSVDDTLAGITLSVAPVRVQQPLTTPWRAAQPPP